MNRLDTSTPLAQISEFVLTLNQPDGSTVRLCVNFGQSNPSLFGFLQNLARRGLIARGGGDPEAVTGYTASAWRKGLKFGVDDGSPAAVTAFSFPEEMEDPFADYPPPRICPDSALNQWREEQDGAKTRRSDTE